MKNLKYILLSALAVCSLSQSCKKDSRTLSVEKVNPATAITDATPLKGSIKGVMITSKTYTIDSPGITINIGDTLYIQNGVTVNVKHGAVITVKGVFLSEGTQASPVWITAPGVTKMDNPNEPLATDPAYIGQWIGILADTSCKLMVIKWTHVEFCGETVITQTTAGLAAGKQSYSLFFENIAGNFILEDSWIYGATNDAIRIQGGYFSIMRNNFEKCGNSGNDVVNAKHGSVGIAAYNLFIGTATNGTKASDKGASVGPTCDFDMYNNTYVNGGWKQAATTAGKGATINYEQNAYGNYYNNLIVNSIYGPRVVSNPCADTSRMHYGNTFFYADSVKAVDGFYPVGYITKPKSSDYPNPATYIPNYMNWQVDSLYNAPQLATQNNPLFKNYPLPCPYGYNICYSAGYDFHLQLTSPCIGKGNNTFAPMANPVPIDPIYGASEITPPGSDIGCYQINGTGNQH